MKTILITCAAAITIFSAFEVNSIWTSAHAGAIATQRTTANAILEDALSKL